MTFTLIVNTFKDFISPHPVDKVHPPLWSNPGSATAYTTYLSGRYVNLTNLEVDYRFPVDTYALELYVFRVSVKYL